VSTLFRGVEVEGLAVDVRTAGEVVTEIGPDLPARGSEVVEGRGGALLPGLHDHHVHLLATAAARASVDCSTRAGLESLREAPGNGWVRGTGYHESVAGPLDRHVLDKLVPDRPVRVQHRSGALWILNSRALELIAPALDADPDIERDASGTPNGRLWRYDERLRRVLPAEMPDLAALARTLTSYGITSITDATPGLGADAIALIARDIAPVARVTVLGATGDLPPGLRHGPAKLLLRDHDLPSYNELRDQIEPRHRLGRPVAVHCVTRESLLLTLAVLDDIGVVPGDRIEHGAVVPPEVVGEIAALGLAVVTQPSFLRLRGDDYLQEVDEDDIPFLYPYASLVRAGVPVAASSDAPYGDLDPWRTIADAAERRTASGNLLGPNERVTARVALTGFLSRAHEPGGPPHRLGIGSLADLCLLNVPLAEGLRVPTRDHVRLVMSRGSLQPEA
jgi:predicted amidohydrolase YtcJ